MAFSKKTWEDRISEYPNRRTINDGNTTTQVTVGRDEGVITQAGTAFNASNMNDLEDRIANAVDSKAEQADTYTKAEVDTAIANAVDASVKTDVYADLDTVDKTIIGAINEVAQSGGGGGSTTNYNLLTNKPSINGHELKGNSTSADLAIDYNTLVNKPNIPDVSNYYDKTATDALLADKADISSLATVATSGSYDDLTDKPTIPDVSDYYTKNETDILLGDFAEVATTGDYDDLINTPALAAVATSGDYNDLINRPDIHEYSTQEQLVGKWIDGSNIYERTIVKTNMPRATSSTELISAADLASLDIDGSKIVELNYAFFLAPSSIPFTSNIYLNSSSIIAAWLTGSGAIYYQAVWSTAGAGDWYVTLRYTKEE